ncbi:hypothetical protein [Shewanella halotolerans]|uniref:hypothetical protein n=1 Tax=Shewanella halotolerans TaxID=2864204 RepID=UPI001C661475|nr:hypothetical protein [Shewanella halotolerans]QYJ89783.1 hypothetical protein K0H81_18800 [Shewanella halotolerans]
MSIKDEVIKYLIGFFYVIGGMALLFGALIGAFIYFSGPCLEDEALTKARSITRAEWEEIYLEAVKLHSDKSRRHYNLETLPESIARLEPISVTSHATSLWIYLATCSIDSKVIVFVETSEERTPKIYIGWGDPPQSQELWVMPNKSGLSPVAGTAIPLALHVSPNPKR